MKSEDEIFREEVKIQLEKCRSNIPRLTERNEELNRRKTNINERLQRIVEARAEMSYVMEPRERMRRIQLSKRLEDLEKTLNEEKVVLDAEINLNKQWLAAEEKLAKDVVIDQKPKNTKINLIKETEEKRQSTLIKIGLNLDKLLLVRNKYDQYGGNRMINELVTPCPRQAATGIYPARNERVENIGKAIIATLDKENPPGSGGRSIGIAELLDGRIVITMSGSKKDVEPAMNKIKDNLGKHIPVDERFVFVSEEVATLKLAAPLTEGAVQPSKKCAMPKIYHTAQQLGSLVVSPTEVWWGGPKKAKNPCPDKDDDNFMYPCEFCAWNAHSIQTGTAWK